MLKFKSSDVYDHICSIEQYVEQFDTVIPVLGGVYAQESHSWAKTQFKIVFIDDKIAVGVEISPKFPLVSSKLDYCLFCSSGLFTGWKYNDTNRPEYRLRELI